MLGALRKACNLVVRVWACVVGVVSWVVGRRRSEPPPRECDPGQWGGEGEWESWDSVETFSVKVVPSNSSAVVSQSVDDNQGLPSPTSDPTEEVDDDLFHDMQPVFRKAKKIHLKQSHSQEQSNLQKFAFDPSFQPETMELGVWSEESASWEEGLGQEEGDLLRDSHEVLREKRREERERRRAQQEAMRSSQRAGQRYTGLGTKVAGNSS